MIGAYSVSTTDDAEQRQRALQAEGVHGSTLVHIPITPFARMLGHIGHAYFVQDQDRAEESLLLPIARGDLKTMNQVIGGMPPNAPVMPDPEPGKGIHQIYAYSARANGEDFVIANIRLFSHLRPLPPIYTVVLCRRPVPTGSSYISFARDQGSNTLNIESLIAD
jgi:hypothetical protein